MLCRLLNALSPTKPIDAMRADDPSLANKPDPDRYLRTHNHAAFVRGAKTFGLDDDDMFGLDDLGGLRGDPSKVLRCLTALKWRTDASLNQNKNSGNPFAATTAKTFASSGNPFGEPPAPHAAAARPPLASLGNVEKLKRGGDIPSPRDGTATGRKPPIAVATSNLTSKSDDAASEPSQTGASLFQYGMNLLQEASKDNERVPASNDTSGFPGFSTRGGAEDGIRGSSSGGNPFAAASAATTRTRGSVTERAGSYSAPRAPSAPGGPNVLESVLAKITQEYERRLLTKESELVRARETLSEAYKREGRLTQRAEELKARCTAHEEDLTALRRANANTAADAGTSSERVVDLERRLATETAQRLAAEKRAEESDSLASGGVSADAFVNAENAAREATVKLQAAIQERRLAEGTLERKSEECERVRTELNELVLKHERAMEGAEANAETAAAAAYEREISNLKGALAREKARGVEAGARLASDAAELRTALDATRREFELEKRSFAAKEFQLVESVEELSSRAALYDKAFAENRHLHNAIQDLKGSIRVFCRVRPHLPSADGAENDVVEVSGEGSEGGNAASQGIAVCTHDKRGNPDRKAFSFDRVFDSNSTQGGIYEECSALIRCVCDGYNVCFMAYGQTGSGKTYTMSGPSGAESSGVDRGINYRALDDLFDLVKERKGTHSYAVSVSVLEIYNEQCRDLLAAIGGHKVEILPTKKAGFNVPTAVTRTVTSRRDVAEVMFEGEVNRATGATAMNERSSRSHSIVIVHVEGVTKDTGTITRGVLYLVDLAGSERLSRSEATGERLKEAQHINKSLSALGDVVSSLQTRSPHVPYRNSKLTSLLQGALGRSGKALIFMHVSPTEGSASETVSTLNFATRVASVELGRAAKNAETSEMATARTAVAKLEDGLSAADEEIARLKRELDKERSNARVAFQTAESAERKANEAARRAKDADARAERVHRSESESARSNRSNTTPRAHVKSSGGGNVSGGGARRTGGGWHTPNSGDRTLGSSGGYNSRRGYNPRPSTAPSHGSAGILKRRSSYVGTARGSPTPSHGSIGSVSGQNLSAHPPSPANVSFSHADTSEASFLSEDIDASAFIQSDAVDDDDAISVRSTDVSTTASSPFERTAKAAEDLRQAVNRRSPAQTLTRNPFESMHGTNPFAPAPVQTTTATTCSNNDVAIRQAAAAKLAAARAERAVANARAASFERPSSPSPPATPPPMHSPGVLPPEVNVPLSPAAPAFSPAGMNDVMSPLTALARGHCTPSPPQQQRRLHRLSVTGGAPIGAFVPQSKPETQDTSPSPGEKKKSNKSVSYKLWSNAARAVGLKATKKKAAPKQWA